MEWPKKCDYPECGRDCAICIIEVACRRCVNKRGLCREHGKSFLSLPPYEPGDADIGNDLDQSFKSVDIESLLFDYTGYHGEVSLRGVNIRRPIRIHLGYFEILNVFYYVGEHSAPRPLTHMALASVIASLGGSLQDVVLDEFDQQARYFLAKLRIQQSQKQVVVDVRPSDAIALALYCGVPILVSEHILRILGRKW
jgi:bifunctional DNase/RNase